MEKEKLCLRCMRKIGNNTSCPYCKDDNSEPQKSPYLPLKTVIGGKYLIGKLCSSNSEGATYYGFDLDKKLPVTVRELYPDGLVSRGDGNYCLVNVGKASDFIDIKEDFINLWTALSELRGYTALTHVIEIVEDLGTVFAITEYLGEGQSLREYLLQKEQGYISWDEARVLFMPVLSALDELHCAGIIHGGISPTTLVIDKYGKMRITGYCIEQVRREKSSMEPELFEGYAAVEQYGFSSGLGASTDMYAFAAVLYRALIGSTPIGAASRLTNDKLMIPGRFAEKLPAYVINALINALQILPDDRTANAEQLRDELSASPVAVNNATEEYASYYGTKASAQEVYSDADQAAEDDYAEEEVEEEEPQRLRKSTIAAFVISAVLCLAILVVALVGIKGRNNDDTTTTTESSETTEENTEEETVIDSVISISTPDFRGMKYEDIKNDETYKKVFDFNTEYVDDEADKGTVISQNIAKGTEVSSENPRKITLKISNGLEVPKVDGKTMQRALTELQNAGFKNVKCLAGNVATDEEDSMIVYSVVYNDPATGTWAALPSDRRLSASDEVLLYYYGEFETTTEATTQPETTRAPETTEENTEAAG